MRILVATDLTSRSDRAMTRAFLLAQELKGTLRAVHIVDADLPDALKAHTVAQAHAALSAQTTKLSVATGVVAAVDVSIGSAHTDILRLAESTKANLIVLGVHDRGAKTEFSKTTAGKILRSIPTSALIVKGEADKPYERVVLGVDFSPSSRAAFHLLLQVAPQADLSLVHAYRIPFEAFLGSPSFRKQFAEERQLEFEAFLKSERESLMPQLQGRTLASIMEEGEPLQVIRKECDRIGAQLMAIARPRRADFFRLVWKAALGVSWAIRRVTSLSPARFELSRSRESWATR